MILTLKRVRKDAFGVFSNLMNEEGHIIASCLEHSYDYGDGHWEAKITEGEHECVRGMHTLHNNVEFETFEITGIVGHKGLLFHWGNKENDSEGCVLMGDKFQGNAVINSRQTFAHFLAMFMATPERPQVDRFTLRVIG